MIDFMITRPDGRRWTVRLSVARRGGWRAWLAVNADFEHDLAGQESDAIVAPHIEAESRRGRDYVRVTIEMTVIAPDIAQALTAVWWAFRKAVGNDTEGWDMASATAEARPGGALAARVPCCPHLR
jgi:hypothetical protein